MYKDRHIDQGHSTNADTGGGGGGGGGGGQRRSQLGRQG